MTLHQLLRVLSARKWWIVWAIVVCVAVAGTVVAFVPKRYVATASVVVNGRGNDPLMLTSSLSSGAAVSMSTQADIVKRPRVANRVVHDLRMDADPALKAAWDEEGRPGGFESWLGQRAVSGVSTVSTSDSNVIDVQYSSTDPAEAARMANAFATAYLETTLDLRTDPARQYVAFFDERLVDLRDRVAKSQARLSAFEKQSGLVNAAGRMDVENARLTELSSQLASAQGLLADASSRRKGTMGGGASPDVMANPLVQQLKGQLSLQAVKVKELSLRLGPNHPEFRQAQGELSEIRARLNAEVGQVTASIGTSQDVSVDRVAAIQAALDAQRERVLSLQEQRDQADVMSKEVANAQRAYDLVMQRQTQTTLESQAQQTDVSILDRASTPASAAFPRTKLTLLLAVLIGALSGIVLALAREFFMPVVRSGEDLLLYTGLPVLAVVPSARLPRVPRLSLSAPRTTAA